VPGSSTVSPLASGSGTEPAVLALPAARRLCSDAVSSTAPVVRAVQGSASSGAVELLHHIDRRLVAQGRNVWRPGNGRLVGFDAVIVDESAALGASEHEELMRALERSDRTILLLAPPHMRDKRLSQLLERTITAEPAVQLTPMTRRDIATAAHAVLGAAVLPLHVQAIYRASAGLAGVVDAVLQQFARTAPIGRVHVEALVDRAAESYFSRCAAALDTATTAVLEFFEIPAALTAEVIAAALNVSPERADDLLAAARNSGLLAEPGFLPPPARTVVQRTIGVDQLSALRPRLHMALIDSDALSLRTAQELAREMQDPRLAEFLADAARRAAPDSPAAAHDLFALAVRAGAARLPTSQQLALEAAETAGRAGDLVSAQQLADGVINTFDAPGQISVDEPELDFAVRIAASAATANGTALHAADLYRWLGPDRVGSQASAAAIVLASAGNVADARAFTAASRNAAPTATRSAWTLLAEGFCATFAGDGTAGLSAVNRAAAVLAPLRVNQILPDHPAAVAATAALHCGEAEHAEAILVKAMEHAIPDSWARSRLSTLHGFAALAAHDLHSAARRSAALPADLDARGKLWAHALAAGIARRSGDAAALRNAWAAARDAVRGHSADVLSLLPVGELWLAASQLGERKHIQPLVDELSNLLRALGDPPLWAALFHWWGIRSGLIENRPDFVIPHAQALARAAQVSTFAATLAQAGQTWTQVLAGTVEPTSVESAAQGLRRIGLAWDGARLAADAASRAGAATSSTVLLQVARALKPMGRAEGGAAATTSARGGGTLSDREADVAELVVLGMPYKHIGSQLFISAKTVEHHVARIRQRIGAEDRAEMLVMLRAMGFPRRT
jgi:DNA-binding CsgD family transcriptional regulator